MAGQKDSMAVAYVAPDLHAEVSSLGALGTRQCDIAQLLRKMPSTSQHLMFVYEAGPCGSWLSRSLTKKGHACWVVAPSLIPKKADDRSTTYRRDALQLARLRRSGALTPVSVPQVADEALRDLRRARADALRELKTAKHRLKAFLLRHGYRYQGKANWSQPHIRYLRELVLPHPAMKTILEEYLQGIDAAHARVERIEASMLSLLESWRLKPAVQALMAFRGFQLVAAMITVSELGDIHRFEHPRQLMTYLGLVPTQDSSGPHQRLGPISRCGNGHQRWLLIECAEHYFLPPKISKELSARQEGQPQAVRDLSWKAQNRLHLRFRRLLARRLQRNKAKVAVARELCGFVWALLRSLECYRTSAGGATS